MPFSQLQADTKSRMVASLRRRELRDRLGQVYIAEAFGTGRVKIGFSVNALKRLQSVAIICPTPMRLLALLDGPPSLERELHERFSDAHSHGEWFELSPRLETFIRKNMLADPMMITCSKSAGFLPTALHRISPF